MTRKDLTMEPEQYFEVMFYTMCVVIIAGLSMLVASAVISVIRRVMDLRDHIKIRNRRK